MNDLYTTAINTQKATVQWMDVLADNLTNVYTPGFRENKTTFKTAKRKVNRRRKIINFFEGES